MSRTEQKVAGQAGRRAGGDEVWADGVESTLTLCTRINNIHNLGGGGGGHEFTNIKWIQRDLVLSPGRRHSGRPRGVDDKRYIFNAARADQELTEY